MAGMGGYGGGCDIRAVVVAGKFRAEAELGVGKFAGGGEHTRVGRAAEDCGADYSAGGTAGDAGSGEGSAAAAG